MSITLNIPSELEASLEAQARAHGKSLEVFLLEIVAAQVVPESPQQLGITQWEQELDDWLDHVPDVPSLPDEALRRESIYTREDKW